jgi:cytochrome c oxidase assembly factor CtaG
MPGEIWTAWSFEPGLTIPLALSGLLYAWGRHKAPRSGTGIQSLCYWSGWIFLALALISPLHEMGESLFSAHMVQHEVLMLLAAPLLVMARPLAAFLHALPFEWRRAVGRWSKLGPVAAFWHGITRPFNAWLIHAVALWAWHYPPFFQATLTSDWIHAAQHLSFFGSALLFWWALFYGRGHHAYGAAVLYIFSTGIHTGILGALLTLSSRVWYPAYLHTTAAWGLMPLEDQQLGGVVMWVPASLVYLAAGLALLNAWIRASDRGAAQGLIRTSAALAICVCALFSLNCGSSYDQQAIALTGGDPRAGITAIGHYGCGSCHTIPRVTGAHGQVGPPLAGVGGRRYIAGELPNTPDNLIHWIQHPQQVNDKTAMPELGVNDRDARNIAALLTSLQKAN